MRTQVQQCHRRRLPVVQMFNSSAQVASATNAIFPATVSVSCRCETASAMPQRLQLRGHLGVSWRKRRRTACSAAVATAGDEPMSSIGADGSSLSAKGILRLQPQALQPLRANATCVYALCAAGDKRACSPHAWGAGLAWRCHTPSTKQSRSLGPILLQSGACRQRASMASGAKDGNTLHAAG